MVQKEALITSVDYYAHPIRISGQVRKIKHKSIKIKIRKQELNNDISQGDIR